MKKMLLIIVLSLFVLGCDNVMNTPSKKVESFFSRYQNLNIDVLDELDNMISRDSEMNKKEKEEYKKLLEKQYQNLSYKIKNEEVDNQTAIVDVEIEVFDYSKAINNSRKYYIENNKKSYTKYKLEEMEKVTDKKKYEITFYLTKIKGIWEIENLREEDILKIHGLY